MQVLKEDTRKNIELSALKLFRENGYNGVSMRKIATDSHMTVGNIYRYYENKDDLFKKLLTPAIEKILSLLDEELTVNVYGTPEINRTFVNRVIHMFLEIHRQYSDELFILVHGVIGSPLENIVENVIDHLGSKILILVEIYNKSKGITVNENFIARILSESIIHSFIKILYEFDNDEDRMIHMLQIQEVYTTLYISGIHREA